MGDYVHLIAKDEDVLEKKPEEPIPEVSYVDD